MTTIPTGGAVPVPTECASCTVPTADGGLCSFCQSYVPPETAAQRLDVTVNRIDLIRADLNSELRNLPIDAPLLAVADIAIALNHLREAAVALDKAVDTIEAAASTEAVQR